MTAAGAVSDYDDAKKADLECAMAAIANVACDKVTVTVTAGSVMLDFVIIAANDAEIATLTTAIAAVLATPAAATAALGVTVESAPTIAAVRPACERPLPVRSQRPPGANCTSALASLLRRCLSSRRRRRRPRATTTTSPQARSPASPSVVSPRSSWSLAASTSSWSRTRRQLSPRRPRPLPRKTAVTTPRAGVCMAE